MRHHSFSRVAAFVTATTLLATAACSDSSTLSGPHATVRQTNSDSSAAVSGSLNLTVIVGAGDPTADTLAYTPLPGSTVALSTWLYQYVSPDSMTLTVTPVASGTTKAGGVITFSGLSSQSNYQIDVTPPSGSGVQPRRIRVVWGHSGDWTVYSPLYPPQ